MGIKYTNRYWRTIRASYEADGLTIVQLAVKYKPSRVSIYDRSRKEKWVQGIVEASAKHNAIVVQEMVKLNNQMIEVPKYANKLAEEMDYQVELINTRNKNNYLNSLNQAKVIKNTKKLIKKFDTKDKFAVQKNKVLADTTKSLHSEDKQAASTNINVNTQVNIHNYDNYSDDELEKEIIELQARLATNV
jgi:hypothetical protein